MSFGAKIIFGYERQNHGDASDHDVNALLEVRDVVDADFDVEFSRPYLMPENPFLPGAKQEVWLNLVNHKMTGGGEESYGLWTVGLNPYDVRSEPWGTNPPLSIEVDCKGFVGAVGPDLAKSHEFDDEANEPLGPGPTHKSVCQHFVNVIADVNCNGVVDTYDDIDVKEDQDIGWLIVNREGSPGMRAGTAPSADLRLIVVRFSKPPQGMSDALTDGYELWIEIGGVEPGEEAESGIGFWYLDAGGKLEPVMLQNVDPADPAAGKAWRLPIQGAIATQLQNSDQMFAMYVTAGPGTWSEGKASFFLMAPPDASNGQAAYGRISMDRINIKTSGFGIDADVNNDGVVDANDDQEEDWRTHVLLEGDGPSEMRIQRYEHYSVLVSPTAHLKTSVAGRASVKSADGSNTLLPGPTTTTTSYELTAGEWQGQGPTSYQLRGHKAGQDDYGEVDLSVEVLAGQKVVAYDWIRCVVVKIELTAEHAVRDLGGSGTDLNLNSYEILFEPADYADAYRIDIRRAAESSWYTLSNNRVEEDFVQRVAGTFKLRGAVEIFGEFIEVYSDELDLEVRFPDFSGIIGDSAVVTHCTQAWSSTKSAANETDRREECFWILLDTETESYEFSSTVVQEDPTPNAVSPSGFEEEQVNEEILTGPNNTRPEDSVSDPDPNAEGVRYVVAWFHTHTPTAYRTGTATRATGPSQNDKDFHQYILKVPGIVADYVGAPIDGSSENRIPMGHPLNSTAKFWYCGPPIRRDTP